MRGYLDGALADFSGYIAVDELYDGPFCVLSIVDNHNFKRLIYEVLDHDPTHKDITRFFRWFRKELHQRDLKLLGVTTDGSPLYPEPLAEIFNGVSHQICEFPCAQGNQRQNTQSSCTSSRSTKEEAAKAETWTPLITDRQESISPEEKITRQDQ
jgi:hypothetical protein